MVCKGATKAANCCSCPPCRGAAPGRHVHGQALLRGRAHLLPVHHPHVGLPGQPGGLHPAVHGEQGSQLRPGTVSADGGGDGGPLLSPAVLRAALPDCRAACGLAVACSGRGHRGSHEKLRRGWGPAWTAAARADVRSRACCRTAPSLGSPWARARGRDPAGARHADAPASLEPRTPDG